MDGFDPLQAFSDFIMSILQPFVDFIAGFLPYGDANVFSVIDTIGQVGASMTFNVFYFVDWGAVLICFQVLVSVSLIVHLINFVLAGIRNAHYAVEAVPIVE